MPFDRPVKRILIVCITAFGVCMLPSRGSDSLAMRYAAEMTHLPVGSDIVALGETGVVLPRHCAASIWNAATPAFLKRYEFSAEFADLYQGMSQHGCIALSMPLAENIGTSVMYLPFFSGPIDRYDTLVGSYTDRDKNPNLRPNGVAQSSFSNYQHLILFSVAKLFSLALPRSADAGFPLPLEIGTGCTFKSFWQTMRPDTVLRMGMGVNLDAGMIMRIGLDYDIGKKEVSRQALLGLAARDFLPSPVIYINSRDEYEPEREYREEITPAYYAGLSYVDKSGDLGGAWTLTAAIEKQYKLTYHYGIEAEFMKMIAFRAGLSDKVPTIGAGVRYRRYFLDYTFRFDELAYSYVRLAFGFRF
jgi:hypothetical protein